MVREPSTPVSAFLPPTALLHSRGAMPPSWLPPQHLSYRIAQSVQGPSPRFLFGLSLACTHAVLWPRRLSKHGCLKLGVLGRAILCFLHFHIIRDVAPPPLTCTTSSRTARLMEEPQRLGPLPPRVLWRLVETECSPDSARPISPGLGRTAAELDHPQGWQLSSPMWLHKHNELGSPRLAFRVRYTSSSTAFTSDSLLSTSHPLNTHL